MHHRRHSFRPGLAPALVLALASGSIASPVCLEAETATGIQAPMRLVTSAVGEQDAKCLSLASGQSFLEIPQGAGKPPKVTTAEATLTIEIPKDGTYILWCRVWWDDGCGNSLGMSFDEAKPFTFGQDATYRSWHWVKSPPRLSQLKLAKGTHRLKITNREDGVRIDQLLLTTSRRLVPVEIEPITTTPAATTP